MNSPPTASRSRPSGGGRGEGRNTRGFALHESDRRGVRWVFSLLGVFCLLLFLLTRGESAPSSGDGSSSPTSARAAAVGDLNPAAHRNATAGEPSVGDWLQNRFGDTFVEHLEAWRLIALGASLASFGLALCASWSPLSRWSHSHYARCRR